MELYKRAVTLSLVTFLMTACSGKEAYLISRTLLGYIPPPEVPSVMEQLKEELNRCERAGGSNCEQQAVKYVQTVNESLRRKPMTGVVIITRTYDDVEVEYEAGEKPPVDAEEPEEK